VIEVHITTKGGKQELGKIEIENVATYPDGTGDYSVRFAVDRVHAVGIHQRLLGNFPRLEYNVLALILQALNTLEPEELKLEDGVDSSDLARRQRRSLPKVQDW
jgi:hypothetical protein